MHITLMHNPNAGSGSSSWKELVREFERAGHEVVYHSTKIKKWGRALENPGDAVVIAGGDGAIRKIALRLIGRNVPVAILPLGTANNIAKALGVDFSIKKVIRGLEKARKVKVDVGILRGPWGDVPFLEGVGVGAFPRMMTRRAVHEKEGTRDAVDAQGGMRGGVELMRQTLERFRAEEFSIKLDDAEFNGKYLLIEVMNTPSIGPALELAPEAHHGDGFLNVVIVNEDQRLDLERHLAGGVAKRNRGAFPVHRTRRVQLSCRATEFHFDDQVWPNVKEKSDSEKPASRRFNVEIEVFPGALRVLVPR